MVVALSEMGIRTEQQTPIGVKFRGHSVGDFYADLLVDGKVIVELKAVAALTPQHQAQLINYLKATAIQVGLLINFGNPKLEYRRLTPSSSSLGQLIVASNLAYILYILFWTLRIYAA